MNPALVTLAFSLQPSAFPPNFWRTEPAPGVDQTLAKSKPSYAVQHIYCLGRTDEPLGMVRRVPPGFFRTVWFSAGQIERKRHQTVQAARKFLERKFTRTVPRVFDLPPSSSAPQN